jgi:hypothetical protein
MRSRLFALWSFAALSTAGAQQIRGVVRDATTSAPLPGAVVTLVDSAGVTASRTIADGEGRFGLVSGPRAARLHLIRIGYQPRDVELPSRRDTVLQLAMIGLPPVLAVVHVTDHELCPGSPDRGPAFQLWAEARDGLLAAVVAREAKPADATTLVFERDLAPDDRVRRQRVTTQAGRMTRPFFAAFPARMFAERGYMREDSAGRTYSAPDADVLLDESFAVTHCFHLRSADIEHRSQVGLEFTPVPGRDSIVDVSGVVWLDDSVPALRSLDFQFVGLEPAAASVGTGGHLEFHAMPNGVSFVEWWVLRLPVLVFPQVKDMFGQAPPLPARRRDRSMLRVAEVHESGGQVTAASWADGMTWHQRPNAIVGTVVDRNGSTPVANALATLAGTVDTTLSGPDGQFTFARVLPGKYSLTVIDTTLHAFTSDRVQRRSIQVARGEIAEVKIMLSPLADVIADLCRGQRMRDRTSLLVGRVSLPRDSPMRGGRIHASWQATFNGGSPVFVAGDSPSGARGVSIDNATQDIDLDDEGHFVVCGVARDRPIHLRFSHDNATADTIVFARDSLMKTVEWWPRMASPVEGRAKPPN